jgi:hypothetical protein
MWNLCNIQISVSMDSFISTQLCTIFFISFTAFSPYNSRTEQLLYSIKLKILPVWFFTVKVCQPLGSTLGIPGIWTQTSQILEP